METLEIAENLENINISRLIKMNDLKENPIKKPSVIAVNGRI